VRLREAERVEVRRRRLAERRADAAPPRLRQHPRRERSETRHLRARRKARPGELAVELREEEHPARRLDAPELLDRRRPLVWNDRHPHSAPRVQVGVRLREPQDHPDRLSFPCFLAYRSPVRKTSRPSGTDTRPRTISGHTS